jgi:phosphatidylserine decarboxylase
MANARFAGKQFHYGGSSFCLLFSKGVDARGFPAEQEHNVPVRAELARVKPAKGT